MRYTNDSTRRQGFPDLQWLFFLYFSYNFLEKFSIFLKMEISLGLEMGPVVFYPRKSEKKVKVKSLSHVRLFATPMDCSLPGSSVHGIFQARILEWVATSFSRGSSWPRDQTRVSRIAGRHFTIWATGGSIQDCHRDSLGSVNKGKRTKSKKVGYQCSGVYWKLSCGWSSKCHCSVCLCCGFDVVLW